jgi:hypothetical protein
MGRKKHRGFDSSTLEGALSGYLPIGRLDATRFRVRGLLHAKTEEGGIVGRRDC